MPINPKRLKNLPRARRSTPESEAAWKRQQEEAAAEKERQQAAEAANRINRPKIGAKPVESQEDISAGIDKALRLSHVEPPKATPKYNISQQISPLFSSPTGNASASRYISTSGDGADSSYDSSPSEIFSSPRSGVENDEANTVGEISVNRGQVGLTEAPLEEGSIRPQLSRNAQVWESRRNAMGLLSKYNDTQTAAANSSRSVSGNTRHADAMGDIINELYERNSKAQDWSLGRSSAKGVNESERKTTSATNKKLSQTSSHLDAASNALFAHKIAHINGEPEVAQQHLETAAHHTAQAASSLLNNWPSVNFLSDKHKSEVSLDKKPLGSVLTAIVGSYHKHVQDQYGGELRSTPTYSVGRGAPVSELEQEEDAVGTANKTRKRSRADLEKIMGEGVSEQEKDAQAIKEDSAYYAKVNKSNRANDVGNPEFYATKLKSVLANPNDPNSPNIIRRKQNEIKFKAKTHWESQPENFGSKFEQSEASVNPVAYLDRVNREKEANKYAPDKPSTFDLISYSDARAHFEAQPNNVGIKFESTPYAKHPKSYLDAVSSGKISSAPGTELQKVNGRAQILKNAFLGGH